MKKQWMAMVAVFALLFALTVSASANIEYLDNGGYLLIYDDADVLSDDEETALQEQLESISNAHNADIIVVTTPSLTDDIMIEADNYYDTRAWFSDDAVLLMHSPADREWHISTVGNGINALTDSAIDYVGENMTPFFQSDDFFDAYVTYASTCNDLFDMYEAGTPYGADDGRPSPVWWLIIAVVIGWVLAIIIVAGMKGQLKTVRSQTKADDYLRANSLNLTQKQDVFLYRQVTKRPKPKDNKGSSTHRSASGTTHGGGGGSY